jgi:thiamine transport system permease protein
VTVPTTRRPPIGRAAPAGAGPVAAARHPVGAAAVAAVIVAVGLPVAAVLGHAVRADGAWSLEAAARVLGSARTWRVVAVTVGQAVASTAVTVIVGVPVTWVLTRFRFPGRGPLRTLALVPFVLPSVVVGAAIASLLGPDAPVDLRGTWWAVLAAHLCFNLAVVVRIVGAALEDLDPNLESAARMLGAGPVGAARRVVLPVVAPAVGAAAVVVFLFCLTSFGVIVILGGGPVTTLEVEIWVRATRQFDLSGAAVLATLQVLAVVAASALHGRISGRNRRSAGGPPARGRRPRDVGEWAAVAAAVGAVLAVSGLPLAALVERSFRVGGGHGLAHWRNLGSATAGTGLAVSPVDAVVVSVVTATVAATAAVLVAVPAAAVAARRPGGLADRALLVPLGVSATTLGLGLLLVAGRPPVDLRRSWWLLPLAQALVAVPLVVRAVAPALREMPPNVLDAAAVLGAGGRARWWRVELPMVRPAVVAGAGLALLACLGEFGATVFLTREERPTVPVAVERLMSRPGPAGFGQAMALSCVLVALCAVLLLVVDRLGAGRRGDGVRLGL